MKSLESRVIESYNIDYLSSIYMLLFFISDKVYICITFAEYMYYFSGQFVLPFRSICITFAELFSGKGIHIFRKGYTYIPER